MNYYVVSFSSVINKTIEQRHKMLFKLCLGIGIDYTFRSNQNLETTMNYCSWRTLIRIF